MDLLPRHPRLPHLTLRQLPVPATAPATVHLIVLPIVHTIALMIALPIVRSIAFTNVLLIASMIVLTTEGKRDIP